MKRTRPFRPSAEQRSADGSKAGAVTARLNDRGSEKATRTRTKSSRWGLTGARVMRQASAQGSTEHADRSINASMSVSRSAH